MNPIAVCVNFIPFFHSKGHFHYIYPISLHITMNSQAQQALGYASLLLHDGETPITATNIKTVLDAAGIDILPVYMSLFEKFFRTNDIEGMLKVGTQGSSQPQAAAAAAAPAESHKEAAKKEEEPEEDDDMGFGLFD